MDSLGINVTVSTLVDLKEDNGSLADTVFSERKNVTATYGAIGTDTGKLDRLYYKETELAPSGTLSINLTDLPVAPAGLGSGGAMAKIVQFHLVMLPNADASTQGSGVRIGDATGVNMAKLYFGSVSTTVDVGKNGYESHLDDAGVAVGGNSIKITNLDSSNTVTFSLLLTGRSA